MFLTLGLLVTTVAWTTLLLRDLHHRGLGCHRQVGGNQHFIISKYNQWKFKIPLFCLYLHQSVCSLFVCQKALYRKYFSMFFSPKAVVSTEGALFYPTFLIGSIRDWQKKERFGWELGNLWRANAQLFTLNIAQIL